MASVLGDGISPWLVVFVVLTVCGTAGTGILYQGSAEEMREQNEKLRAENEELREQLQASRTERRRATDRVRELEAQLETRTRDVEAVVSELEERERRLNASRARVAAADPDRMADRRTLLQRLHELCSLEPNPGRRACEGFGDRS